MAKFTGLGGKLSVGTPPVEVAQVMSIGSISSSSDEVEVTTLDNTSGYRDYLPTFKDAGELAVTLVWDPALPTHGPAVKGLWDLFIAQTVEDWEIEFPTKPAPYTATFKGFVKTYPTPSITPDDALIAEISIRVAGTVTLTAGTLTREGGESEPMTAEEMKQTLEEYQRKQGRPVQPPARGPQPRAQSHVTLSEKEAELVTA